LGFGGAFLAASVFSMSLSSWLFNRDMTRSIPDFKLTLTFADFVPFIPRLLLIAFGGGVLTAAVIWYYMEARYRRAQRSARA
jgi:hypothetical protein